MSSYHGWTHAPKEQGGTDPIPGLGATVLDIAFVRGVDNAGDSSITVPSATWTTVGDWAEQYEQGNQNYINVRTITGVRHIDVLPGAVFTLSGCIEWGAAFTATRRVRVGPSGMWAPEGSGPIEFDLGEEGNNNSWGTTLMTNFGGFTGQLLTFEVWQDSGSDKTVVGDTSVLVTLLGTTA